MIIGHFLIIVKSFAIFWYRQEKFGNSGCLCQRCEDDEPHCETLSLPDTLRDASHQIYRCREGDKLHWTVGYRARPILSEYYSPDLAVWLIAQPQNLQY